jgi:hypothetical protein
LIAAVKNIDAIAGDRVMKYGAGVFGNEIYHSTSYLLSTAGVNFRAFKEW